MEEKLKHSELTDKIIRTFYEVYNERGFGFLESVYENSLAIALREKGFVVLQQIAVPVWLRGSKWVILMRIYWSRDWFCWNLKLHEQSIPHTMLNY